MKLKKRAIERNFRVQCNPRFWNIFARPRSTSGDLFKSSETRCWQKRNLIYHPPLPIFSNIYHPPFPSQSADTMATTTKWTRFCGEDGKEHNTNLIECPNCGATNPILLDHRPPRAKLERDIIDIDAIQPRRVRPSGITVSTTGQRFQTYPGRNTERPRNPTGPSSDTPFRACAHFFFSFYDIIAGVPLTTRLQSIGTNNEF